MSGLNVSMIQPSAVENLKAGNSNCAKLSNASNVKFGSDNLTDEFIKSSLKNKIDKTESAAKPKVSVGKKLGSAVASAFIPGLGQAANGQWGKAAGFFFGIGVADTIGFVLGGPIGASIAHSVISIWNIVDAYRHAS